jgi:hypothetical protein
LQLLGGAQQHRISVIGAWAEQFFASIDDRTDQSRGGLTRR